MNDNDITRNRKLIADVLMRPELREMRRKIQEAYAEACAISRNADAHARSAVRGFGEVSCMGRDIGEARLRYADSIAQIADEAWAEHTRLTREYDAARTAALIEIGADEHVSGLATSQELQAHEDREAVLLSRPPVGWGVLKYQDEANRIAAWQQRPACERIRDLRPRT